MVEWAKHIPHFASLPLEDQVLLLKSGWNELLIASFSHKSMDIEDGIILSTGTTLYKNTAQQAGVGSIFDRVITELVEKMKNMNMDKTELGCLRYICKTINLLRNERNFCIILFRLKKKFILHI